MTARIERPLSPHLQTYRVTLTMALSIIHRATGIALYFGTLLLAWCQIGHQASDGVPKSSAIPVARWMMESAIVRVTRSVWE